jgi:hypothetical protein
MLGSRAGAKSGRAELKLVVGASIERPPARHHSLHLLAPTWENIEEQFHRLWGQAKDGVYDKDRWGALHNLLTRRKHEP